MSHYFLNDNNQIIRISTVVEKKFDLIVLMLVQINTAFTFPRYRSVFYRILDMSLQI